MLGPTTALLLVASAVTPFPATVNGRPITEAEVGRAVRDHVRKTSFHRQLTDEQLAAERERAVQDLVTDELRAQEARRRGLTIPMEPIRKLAAAEEANAGGPQAFEKVLAANGIDRARYLEVIERVELAKRLVEAEVAARVVEPTREDALAHYRANPSRYVVGESVHALELCVRVDPAAADAQWEKAKEQAEQLRARLAAGGDFGQAARDVRCDAFAEKGGDLGFVHRGSLDPVMDQALWAVKDGDVTAPVRTIRGWHLLRRVETRSARPVPFDQVDASIRAELRQARREEIVKRLDAALRAAAHVVVAAKG